MQNEETPRGFAQWKLPWIAAGGILILLVLTLNQWVNLRSLPVVAKVAGWDWTLPVQWPLFFIVTYPFRWLPGGIQPLALNLFSAVCGALVVWQLVRSVALLPHDRTHEQRIRERNEFSLLSIPFAWVPPVLAACALAFQLTFWEHATAVTGETLNLLLFAYVIRCLLEFRVSQKESWLIKLAFVFGLGITNDWAFIGFFIPMVIALIWIRGKAFFNLGFLGKMLLAGLAGLLLYFVLPLVWVFSGAGDFGFIDILRANWASQKALLIDTSVLRNRALLLSLTSVLPVLLMGIRWPSAFGDTSAAGAFVSIIMFRVVHLFFLCAALFVIFDPPFSPRALGLGLPFLTFHYLGALAIGYYSGYALLTFSDPPKKSWRKQAEIMRLVNPVVRGVVLLLVIAVPAALIYKNYALVKAEDGRILKSFAADMAKSLPEKPAYLLSEDPSQILLLEGYFRTTSRKHDYVFVNTRALTMPSYHEELIEHYGDRWPRVVPENEKALQVEQVTVQRLAAGLAETNAVYYLHPSFGYFFEKLYAVPHGHAFALQPYAPGQVTPPKVDDAVLKANHQQWRTLPDYAARAEALQSRDVDDAKYVAHYFSRALNYWGVTEQRHGNLKEAGAFFARAAQLNTNNLTAFVNSEFNDGMQKGQPPAPPSARDLEGRFGRFQIEQVLLRHGPFDEPQFCFWLGSLFLSQSLHRQAIQELSRTVHFQPTNYAARIEMAKAHVYGNWTDEGMKQIADIRSRFPNLPVTNQLELISLEAAGHYARNDFPKAEQTLMEARRTFPNEPAVLQSLFELYRATQHWTNALDIAQLQLQRNPTNPAVLLKQAEVYMGMNDLDAAGRVLDSVLNTAPKETSALLYKAFIALQQKQYDAGLQIVDRILEYDSENPQALVYKGIMYLEKKEYDKALAPLNEVIENDPTQIAALRNRALLNLRADRLKAAREDYEKLVKIMPTSYAIYYGLGEIAYKEKDLKEAEEYYEKYLKYAPPVQSNAELEEEKSQVRARLQEIRTASK